LRTELFDITNQGTNKPASLLPSGVGSTRYLMMQSVPWFNRRDLQRDVAKAQATQANGQISATWLELAGKIKSAYAMHYYLSDSERLTRDTQALLSKLEQIARTRYANGIGTQQEVIRAQMEQTDLHSELLALQNEQHHVHVNINTLLSRPSGAELAEPVQPMPVQARLDYALLEEKLRAKNPQLQIAGARVNEAGKGRDLALNNRYPGFTLGLAPNQFGSTVKSWDLMVELNIPLQQESRRSQEREAEARLAASAARRESLLNQMLSDLAESVSGLDSAMQTQDTIVKRLQPQAELSFQSALNGYQNGRVDFATLLEAQRQILKARQQRIRAQYEVQLRQVEIERLTGEEL
jgi:outer membrane protein TolC